MADYLISPPPLSLPRTKEEYEKKAALGEGGPSFGTQEKKEKHGGRRLVFKREGKNRNMSLSSLLFFFLFSLISTGAEKREERKSFFCSQDKTSTSKYYIHISCVSDNPGGGEAKKCSIKSESRDFYFLHQRKNPFFVKRRDTKLGSLSSFLEAFFPPVKAKKKKIESTRKRTPRTPKLFPK